MFGIHDLCDWITMRVEKGAIWLDEVAPGWELHVKPAFLAMRNGYTCICGQVFREVVVRHRPERGSGFGYVLAEYMNDDFAISASLGFSTFTGLSTERSIEWGLLESAWLIELEKRGLDTTHKVDPYV